MHPAVEGGGLHVKRMGGGGVMDGPEVTCGLIFTVGYNPKVRQFYRTLNQPYQTVNINRIGIKLDQVPGGYVIDLLWAMSS